MEKIKMKPHYYKYWKDLIKPKGFQLDYDSLTSTYGKFTIRPLERGYGLTLGNAIRRVLLSSMMGSAVSAVKFEGILHEFTSIPDVLEDITDIILNLKQLRFSQGDAEDKWLKINKEGPGIVTAKDIKLVSGIEVTNPEQLIATLGKNVKFNCELLVTFNRGYIEADEQSQSLPVGFIPIDAIHSPIRRVNYVVTNARVGQKTDYDCLILEVWTDGSLSPKEAVPMGYKILKEQIQVFMSFVDEDIEPKEQPSHKVLPQMNRHLFRPVEDMELSVRSANCLKNARIRFIGDLVTKTEQEMLRTKNFGRKSLNEIKDIIHKMGLSLGMTIEGWPPPNLQAMIEPPATTSTPPHTGHDMAGSATMNNLEGMLNPQAVPDATTDPLLNPFSGGGITPPSGGAGMAPSGITPPPPPPPVGVAPSGITPPPIGDSPPPPVTGVTPSGTPPPSVSTGIVPPTPPPIGDSTSPVVSDTPFSAPNTPPQVSVTQPPQTPQTGDSDNATIDTDTKKSQVPPSDNDSSSNNNQDPVL